MSLFGNVFDFNNDGQLDAFERAAECQFFNEVIMDDDVIEDECSDDVYDDEF